MFLRQVDTLNGTSIMHMHIGGDQFQVDDYAINIMHFSAKLITWFEQRWF
jgi:hypothetical protein